MMERNYSIDTLRTIAILLMILLHVSAEYVLKGMQTNAWNSLFIPGNVVDSFCRICVPLFVLISGYLLLGRNEPVKVFYTKRLSRILIPLVVWSLFYALYSLYWLYIAKGRWDLASIVISFALGKPFYHLWYLYMLIGLYAAVPVVDMIIVRSSRKQLWIIAGTFVVIAIASSIYDHYSNNKPFFIFWFINYLGYFLLGYLLKFTRKVSPILLLSIYILSCTIIVFLTYLTATQYNNLYFFGYNTPFVLIGSIAIYKLFVQINLRENLLSKLGSISLGIYLVHAAILDLITKHYSYALCIDKLNMPYAEMTIKFALTLTITLVIVFAFSRNKWLRRVI